MQVYWKGRVRKPKTIKLEFVDSPLGTQV